MEQKLNEETKLPPTRERRKESRFSFSALLTRIKEDVHWYYDIRLWSPLLVVLFLLALFFPTGRPEEPVPETQIAVVETQPMETTEPEPTQEPADPEAEALARLADSVGAGRTNNVKTIIMWIAINRSEDRANGYGQSLLDEIARPNQWQGYDENASYTDGTYAIAKEVLETQAQGGLRPLDTDMLWLVLNADGSVTVRNRFTSTANQKWTEKTFR